MKHLSIPLLAALLGACDSPAPTPADPPVGLRRVENLAPGERATVYAANVRALRTLALDGAVTVTGFAVVSDSVATFAVPPIRPCETDGRTVRVVANGRDAVEAALRAPGALALEPGESRVLAGAALGCIQLPASDHGFVLSVVSTVLPSADVETPADVLRVRAWTAAGAPAAPAGARQPPPLEGRFGAEIPPPRHAGAAAYLPDPVPYDPGYAAAAEGDTVRFVDWPRTDAGARAICALPRDSVPSFPAAVVAAEGPVAIAVDLRHPDAAKYLDPARNEWLRAAARATGRVLLPTMRSVFDPDFAPPSGGGGRYYALLSTLVRGSGYAFDGNRPGGTSARQGACPAASEMIVTLLNAAGWWTVDPPDAGALASTMIHEYAHNVDDILQGESVPGTGVLNEAWATIAEETAARLATGQDLGARQSLLGPLDPWGASAAYGMWGFAPERSPWQAEGRYGAGARMLLYLRELAGEASVAHGRRPTYYQRLYAQPVDWMNRPATAAALAASVGMTPRDLVDAQALASVTAGLLPPEVARARGIVPYTAWDHAERARTEGPLSPGFAGRVSRRESGERVLRMADGSHAALYFLADDRRGVSLEVTELSGAPMIVRITRIQ